MTSSDLHAFADIGVRRREEAPCSRALSPSRLPGLDFALNPYRGCSHGCLYCYAPALLHVPVDGWTAALPKRGLLRLLEKEAASVKGVVGVGTSTDPYQPLEAEAELTRGCLRILNDASLGCCVHTKSDLVLRDIDLLEKAEVGITVTNLSDTFSSTLEPGAPLPQRRLDAVKGLCEAGVDVFVMVGPLLSPVEGREEELAAAIAASGASMVMVDTLNKRTDHAPLRAVGVTAAAASCAIRFKEAASSLGLLVRDAF